MTKTIGQEILEGLEEAIAYADGKATGVRVHTVNVPDVKAIRKKLGMSQSEFAGTYHIPLATLKGWELERRRPDATASAYLTVIAKNPDAARNAFSS